jgi:hypothetical protein
MANPANLPPSIMAQIKEVTADIPPQHHDIPEDGGPVSSVESAILHLNNWAFLNGYGYVNTAGSAKERRWRYKCVFNSRGESQETRNSRKIDEKDRVRVNTHTRGIGCPVGVTITQ